jgi:hypothetical protein
MRDRCDGIAWYPDLAKFFAKLPNSDEQLAVVPRITHTSTRSQNRTLMYQLFDRSLR